MIKDIPVEGGPIYLYSESRLLYVANSASDIVSVINITKNNTVIKNITVEESPVYFDSGPNLYVANFGSDTVSVINTTDNTVIKDILVEGGPTYLYYTGDFLYVANYYSNDVAVIRTATNAIVEKIPVGQNPSYIYVDTYSEEIYVANSGSDTVSVIDGTTNNFIKNLTVGEGPSSIDPFQDAIYVANSGSNTVSVINTTDNTVIKNIPVGDGPKEIFHDLLSNDLYVANTISDGVSIINPATDKVVARVAFDVSPFKTGDIRCHTDSGELDALLNRFMYVSSGTECLAKPHKGYEFSSWGEVLEDNSTRTITSTSGSPLNAFLDSLNLKYDDPEAKLVVNRFGNFTAYFRTLPSPLPAGYWASLFTVVATALVGSLLIPAVIGWSKSKRQTSRLKSFHEQMALAYEDRRLDEKDLSGTEPVIQKHIRLLCRR